jgi:hypothetical protein
MAQIRSLDQMESIVTKNKTLSWDGWTVVESVYNPTAWRNKNGAIIKGKWYTQKRFVPSRNGWDIPNKFVGQLDAQKRVER